MVLKAEFSFKKIIKLIFLNNSKKKKKKAQWKFSSYGILKGIRPLHEWMIELIN